MGMQHWHFSVTLLMLDFVRCVGHERRNKIIKQREVFDDDAGA
jgi:hypothetical protein